jgi:hypothetical protein
MNPILLGDIGDDFSCVRKDVQPTHDTEAAPSNFEDARFLTFLKSNYQEEEHLRDSWTSAMKLYDACAQGSLKAELKRAYESTKETHEALLCEARVAYMAASSGVEGCVEDAAADAARETHSKQKKQRSKKNTLEREPMDQPCGCSCEGVHCGFARTTPEERYDLTTQRRCCNACRIIQNAAMKWLVTMDRSLFYATKKPCWVNQCEGVRELGLGGGRQYVQRKALTPSTV